MPESGGGWRQFLTSLWIWEVWQTIRPTFILLVGDAVLFLLLMGLLTLGHYVIEWVPSSQENKEFLEQLHFRIIVGAWLFFSLIFFVELGMAFVKRVTEHFKH